jgi:hypothetical protein
MRRAITSLTVFCIIAGAAYGIYSVYKSNKYSKEAAPQTVSIAEVERQMSQEMQATPEVQGEAATEERIVVPKELNLEVPFYSQAPLGNWDYPWQEACEEASVLLIANEYLGKNWTVDEFNGEILKLVAWEEKIFGYYTDTTQAEIAQMLKDNFGIGSVIHDNPTYEEIQEILAKGHLIIMTFDGKKIGNPYYKNGGPVYHAMVIKGYKDGEKLITNDVGTSHGADYVYSWKTLSGAMHDWTQPIDKGPRRMLEVLPPSL